MTHKLFETKPGVKFLITTETCNNLQLLFTTEEPGPNQALIIKFHTKETLQTLRDCIDHNGFAYANYNAPTRFSFIKDPSGDRVVPMAYGLSFKSILDHLDFHHPLLYWYIIS